MTECSYCDKYSEIAKEAVDLADQMKQKYDIMLAAYKQAEVLLAGKEEVIKELQADIKYYKEQSREH